MHIPHYPAISTVSCYRTAQKQASLTHEARPNPFFALEIVQLRGPTPESAGGTKRETGQDDGQLPSEQFSHCFPDRKLVHQVPVAEQMQPVCPG